MIQEKTISTGAFEFDCRIAGKEGDEAIILLHGFPETSHMWTSLMEHLASKGFYCIAPNMRGYSKNACPKGVSNYTVAKLSKDVLDIADSFSIQKFHLVAHDWGAAIGWATVYDYGARIISWTSLSVPHNRAFGKAYKTDPQQKKKSRYILWFLIPIIPELMLRSKDFKKFRYLWKHSTPEELEDYLTVFRRKNTLTAALNYYRANLRGKKGHPVGDIQTPTLFIWGNHDLAIGSTAAEGNHKYMKGPYTFVEVDGGHWLMQTNYVEVKEAVTKHLEEWRT